MSGTTVNVSLVAMVSAIMLANLSFLPICLLPTNTAIYAYSAYVVKYRVSIFLPFLRTVVANSSSTTLVVVASYFS